MPRVSIIMPAHDAASFLPETLASVQAQTYSDWEIVAVDDGSRDGTSQLLESAGPPVRALRNEIAKGPAAARNQALAEAGGELVVFLDADDLLEPRYLESQIELFEQATAGGRRIGLVCCNARLLDPSGYAPYTYLDLVGGDKNPLTVERVLRRNPIYITAMVPSEVGTSVGWFDEELFGTEDFGLWVKILERGYEALLNPEPLAVYRRRSDSISSNIARQGLHNRRVYELALERGRLTARQQRIARQAIRYNRAMEEVAQLRFAASERSALRLIRSLPVLIWVAATNPRSWSQWFQVLRGVTKPRPRRAPRHERMP